MKIFEEAKKSSERNQKINNNKNLETNNIKKQIFTYCEKKDNNDFVWRKLNPSNKNVYSIELLSLINNHNFKVVEYWKRLENYSYNECDPILEYYICEKNHYRFKINFMPDEDIENGIFPIYELLNLKNNETTEIYLDLNCRNTSKVSLNCFLNILDFDTFDIGIHNFLEKYLNLENFLLKTKYPVISKKIEIGLNPEILYKLKDNIYIKIYTDFDDFACFITNEKNLDINSSFNKDIVAYKFDYNYYINNLNLLIKMIECFEKHLNNFYGYVEKNKYFNNTDINNFYNNILQNLKSIDYNIINHYLVQFSKNTENQKNINVYDGLEIFDKRQFIINDAAQWSVGKEINVSDILIFYDKKIDKNNCILNITNYIFDNSQQFLEEEFERFKDCSFYIKPDNFEKIIDIIEIKGSFSDIINYLKNYIEELLKIYKIL